MASYGPLKLVGKTIMIIYFIEIVFFIDQGRMCCLTRASKEWKEKEKNN